MNNISNNDVEVAIKLAAVFHSGAVDKLGKPYILHPLAVMMSPGIESNTEKAVAVLHDVLEDTALDLDTLRATMPTVICDAVVALTKTKGEPYGTYLARVAADPLALKIKLADINHNMSRLSLLKDEATADRLSKKYATALSILIVKGE